MMSLENNVIYISVWSPCGGNGKTSTAVGIAQSMARNGYKTLIVPLTEQDDTSLHGVGFNSAFPPHGSYDNKGIESLLHEIEEGHGDDFEIIKNCLAYVENSNIYLLPGPKQRELVLKDLFFNENDYKQVLSSIEQFFDYIIFDIPSMFYRDTSQLGHFAFSSSDVFCFVIEPDERSLLGLFRMFDSFVCATNKLPINPDRCILLINKTIDAKIAVSGAKQLGNNELMNALERYFSSYVIVPYGRTYINDSIPDQNIEEAYIELTECIHEICEDVEYTED